MMLSSVFLHHRQLCNMCPVPKSQWTAIPLVHLHGIKNIVSLQFITAGQSETQSCAVGGGLIKGIFDHDIGKNWWSKIPPWLYRKVDSPYFEQKERAPQLLPVWAERGWLVVSNMVPNVALSVWSKTVLNTSVGISPSVLSCFIFPALVSPRCLWGRWGNPSKKRRKKSSSWVLEEPMDGLRWLSVPYGQGYEPNSRSQTHQQMEQSWVFHHFEAPRAWFLGCWASGPIEPQTQILWESLLLHKCKAGSLRHTTLRAKAGSFSAIALKYCSTGWILPLERGVVHVLGYPGPGGGILLLLCPLLGPFINIDVPSPLTKIIHEKFNGMFLPPLSPSRFCCILDKLELHRGENKRAAQPLVLPASCCSAHFTWYKGHLA